MEIQQLRYLARAAESVSFAQAADDLFVSRAALSKSIGRLESEVGYPLFDRSRDGVRLTAAGERFCAKALAVLDAYDDLQAEVCRASGPLTLAVGIPISWSDAIAPAIDRFRANHPDVRLLRDSMLDADLCRPGQLRTFDVLLTSFRAELPPEEGRLLAESPTCFVMAPDCPLTQRESLRADDLLPYDLVYYLSGFESFDWAPVLPAASVHFEHDIMRAYARVVRDGALLPVPVPTVPVGLDVATRPYEGEGALIPMRGYIAPRLRGSGRAEALADELLDEVAAALAACQPSQP